MLVVWIGSWLLPGAVLPGLAHVPEGPHLIALMADALAGAKRLRVIQQVVDNPVQLGLLPGQMGGGLGPGEQADAGAVFEPGSEERAPGATRPLQWKETLSFIFPDRLRRDAWITGVNRVEIVNRDKQVRITSGGIQPWKPERSDAYLEPLLYRRRFLLQRKLAERGVDFNLSSLGRWEHRLVYVIGARFPEFSRIQLWIDKQNFLPLRWIFPPLSQDLSGRGQSVPGYEITYSGWRKEGRCWYPGKIEFYRKGRLVRRIEVLEVLPEADFAEALFDLDYLESIYGRRVVEKKEEDQNKAESDLDEVHQAIDAFHKKFKD